MIAARTYQSAAENIANAAAIRQRLLYPATPKRFVPEIVSKVEPVPGLVAIPAPDRADVHFDAHVWVWRFSRIGNRPKAHILSRCEQMGIPYRDIISRSRLPNIVQARRLLMLEIRELFGKSTPEIGRLFGGKDHTTVLWALKAAAKRRGEAARAAQEEWAA